MTLFLLLWSAHLCVIYLYFKLRYSLYVLFHLSLYIVLYHLHENTADMVNSCSISNLTVNIPFFSRFAFSALTLLVWRPEGHPAYKKNWVVDCRRGYLLGARRRLAYGPADATASHCLLLQ